jgi:UDP-N-acetyl-D-glucosamine dehydrogenase
MPYHTVQLIGRVLNQTGKTLRDARVLVLGVAFKPNIDDARNSPAERVIELLIREGAKVSYHDPYVPQFRVGGDIVLKDKLTFTNVPLTAATLSQADCAVIVTGHRDIDYKWVVNESVLVVDTVNATRHIVENRHKIVRLGAPLDSH